MKFIHLYERGPPQVATEVQLKSRPLQMYGANKLHA